jgi:hypothetical protein
MNWHDDEDFRFEEPTHEEQEAGRHQRLNQFLEQKNVWTWWEHHFSYDPDMFDTYGDHKTLAQKLHTHPDPIQYFDYLMFMLVDQEQRMIEWLVSLEMYETCTRVRSQSRRLQGELQTLKLKVKQVYEKPEETQDYVTIRLL